MTESSPSNVVDTREVADGAIEKKLSELIALMKSWRIAVNLDERKCTAIAKVQAVKNIYFYIFIWQFHIIHLQIVIKPCIT